MIRWKKVPAKYLDKQKVKPNRCKVFPKGMNSFIRVLFLNKNGKYEGIDEAL